MQSQSYDHGISIRMSRFFNEKSGKSVVVALDHGIALGAVSGLENLGERLEQVLAAQPEGVLLNTGAIRRYGHLLTGRNAPGTILAMDFPVFYTYPGGEHIDGHVPTISADEVARLGAEMVKVCMIFGHDDPQNQISNFSFLAKTIENCHRIGLPVMVEPTTWGMKLNGKDSKNPKLLTDMARMAFELGADIVKSDFPSDPREMEKIVQACPVPIVLLGGSKSPNIEDTLKDVLICIQSGVAGVTFGRNVWQNPNPHKVIKAFQKIVHEENLRSALEVLT